MNVSELTGEYHADINALTAEIGRLSRLLEASLAGVCPGHGRSECVSCCWPGEGVAHPTTLDGVELRPIKTAEQTAAEALRAKYMPQLIKLWDADTERTEFLEAVYGLIVEASKL